MKELTPEEEEKIDLLMRVAPLIMGDGEFWKTILTNSDSERVIKLVDAINKIFEGETLYNCASALFIIFVGILHQGTEEDSRFLKRIRELVKDAEKRKEEDTS
jgi:hypothetical protein